MFLSRTAMHTRRAFREFWPQCIDRRLGDRETGETARAAREAKQRLLAASRKVAPTRATHFDPGDAAGIIAMRKPGAAARTFPDRVRGHSSMQNESG